MDQPEPSSQRATLPLPEIIPPFPKKRMGRPVTYDPDLVNEICIRVSSGETLRGICKSLDFPEGTFRGWVVNDLEGLAARYARCRLAQAEAWADECIAIADDGTNDWIERNDPKNPGWVANGENVRRSMLRVNARQWQMERCHAAYAPKGFMAVATSGGGGQQSDVDIARRLAMALMAGAQSTQSEE